MAESTSSERNPNVARTVNDVINYHVRRDSEREVTIGPGTVIDPYNVSTWPDEQRRNHRLRRALHELMSDPSYRVEVGTKPDGTPGIRIQCDTPVPIEAQEFLVRYREELITYLSWLEQIDAYSGVEGSVPLAQRKVA